MGLVVAGGTCRRRRGPPVTCFVLSANDDQAESSSIGVALAVGKVPSSSFKFLPSRRSEYRHTALEKLAAFRNASLRAVAWNSNPVPPRRRIAVPLAMAVAASARHDACFGDQSGRRSLASPRD